MSDRLGEQIVILTIIWWWQSVLKDWDIYVMFLQTYTA
jgi:hypothetical protein